MSEWLEKVNALADGEMNESERIEFESVLAANHQAKAEYGWALFIKGLLRSKAVRPDHTEAWKASCARLDSIDAVKSSGRVESFVGKYSWGFAAALFALIVVVGLVNRGGSSSSLSDRELAGLFTGIHVTEEQDVTDAHGANEIAQTKLGTQMPRVETVYQVRHVATGTIRGRDFMEVEMLDLSGPLSLIILEGADRFEGFVPVAGRQEFLTGQINGFECVGWTQGEFAYIVAGRRSSDELVSIASRMRG